MFDAKTYNEVRKAIGIANCIFAVALILTTFYLIFTQEHKTSVIESLNILKLNPIVSGLVSVTLISTVWGYISTVLIKLHDRWYEPFLVRWRASYESDFILRSLCFNYPKIISQQLFEQAFYDKRKRSSFMQRLFYKFVGDTKKEHEELISRFYTLIRNYWIIALAELYSLFFLIFSLLYCSFNTPQKNVFPSLFGALILALLFHIWATFYITHARAITVEQINVVLKEHTEAFEKELRDVAIEYNLR